MKYFHFTTLFSVLVSLLLLLLLSACGTDGRQKSNRNTGSPYISLSVNFGEGQKPVSIDSVICEEGATVYSLLKQFPEQLAVRDTLYEGVGHLILAINEHRSDGDANWLYCINGSYATKAADALVLQPGDEVAWHLTSKNAPCN